MDYRDYPNGAFRAWADKAIAGEALTREEAQAVLQTPDDRLLELLDAAFHVRERYFGRKVRLQMLQNAKSGACQEDCGYCSQSAVSTADIRKYGLLKKSQMVEGARRAAQSKAIRYCIVISGRGPLDRALAEISEAWRGIKGAVPIQGCCSLGLLTGNEPPRRCLKILCLFRFLHPRTELRVAGGREFNLRSLQALALYPADSLFVGGYLTTPGMPAPEAWKMIEDLGFEVDTVGAPVVAQ